MKKLSGKYLMVLIAMCGLIGSSLGLTTNTAGLFFTPIAEEFDVGRGTVAMTLTICNLVFALAGMIIPKILNVKSYRPIMIAGTIGSVLSVVLMASAKSIMTLYILSALRGFTVGLLGVVSVTMIINNWFAANTGLVTSIALGFSGIVSAVLSPVLSSVISASSWRTGYQVTAGIMAVFSLPAILFPISLTPAAVDMKAFGAEENTSSVNSDKAEQTNTSGSTNGMLFVLMLIFAMSCSFATSLTQHFPGLAESYGLGSSVGAAMISATMVANTGGKVLIGTAIDHIGVKKANTVFASLCLAGILAIMTLHISAGQIAGAALFGLSYGLATVGTVMAVRDLYGNEQYNVVYPRISMCTTIGNALGSSLVGFMYDATGSYLVSLAMMVALMGAAIFAIVSAYKKKA